MKKYIFFIACLTLFAGSTFAQKVAEEATESSVPSEDQYINDIVPKRMVVESRVLGYEPIREADIAWQKTFWRVIETREQLNLVWRAEEKPFFNVVKDLLENGDITVFEDENFKEPMTFDQVNDKLYSTDTISYFDEDTYEENIKIVKNTKDWHDVYTYRIKEVWFFDEEASMLRHRILGIAPIFEEEIDGVDEPLRYPLFWIYYPEARKYLANHQVVNNTNDAGPMTWTDLIDNRYFSSIIIKRSNILDQRIKDKYDSRDEMFGFDQLMESERIKAELFNLEHDLWTY